MANPDATGTESVPPWRIRGPRLVSDFLSPAVRRVAAALGIDPAAVTGTGTDGRVTREDVALGSPAPERGDEIEPFNNVRKRAAGLLLASKQTSAHTLVVARADYSAIEAVRAEARMTYLPFVARAVCDALRAYPLVNSSVDDDALVVHKAINLGIAVDLDYQGLVVPVVHGADGLRLQALAAAIRDVARRARSKKLTVDDLTGGTFTITNPGASGTWISFPIINQPNVSIVSTDGVSKQVVVDERGRLAIAPVGHLCLTFDHRALDGAYAGAFLEHLRDIVETRDWSTEL
jgi:pyruvate/2-oxoglutarate dehydrogenase complex dihydrolipoamide acyltransferase (E2) component